MRSHISPGVDEVFGAQCRIGSQKLIFAHAQPARLFQHPDWNAGANDARFATANSRGRIDSGKRIVQVLRDEAQQLRLLGATEGWKQFLDFKSYAVLSLRDFMVGPRRLERRTSTVSR